MCNINWNDCNLFEMIPLKCVHRCAPKGRTDMLIASVASSCICRRQLSVVTIARPPRFIVAALQLLPLISRNLAKDGIRNRNSSNAASMNVPKSSAFSGKSVLEPSETFWAFLWLRKPTDNYNLKENILCFVQLFATFTQFFWI